MNGKTIEMQGSETVSTKLQRIAKLAKEAPDMAFTSLNHHIDLEWLYEAFKRTNRNAAPGVDKQSCEDYEGNLDANLRDLLERFKSGRYKAPPVRAVEIPKAGKGTRMIGVPCFEDKVLQRAVAMILEAIYEQDFLDCSYGFRPNRSPHKALDAFWENMTPMTGGWVIEVDIKSYFDQIPPSQLREFISKRVRDGVLVRTINKWLKAGIQREKIVERRKTGTPQGGVISPILSNVYLHEVFDLWFENEAKPRLKGEGFAIRYADDIVIGFKYERDARKVLEVLPKRFAKFGLELHKDKTRLVKFTPPKKGAPKKPGKNTVELLGFSHFWGKSQKGNWVVKRSTSGKRFAQKLGQITEYCKKARHLPIKKQARTLGKKLSGHYSYYGVTHNSYSIWTFYYRVVEIWRKWLGRRSHKAYLNWDKFRRILRRAELPLPKIVHISR